jgi:hypothetical protein
MAMDRDDRARMVRQLRKEGHDDAANALADWAKKEDEKENAQGLRQTIQAVVASALPAEGEEGVSIREALVGRAEQAQQEADEEAESAQAEVDERRQAKEQELTDWARQKGVERYVKHLTHGGTVDRELEEDG